MLEGDAAMNPVKEALANWNPAAPPLKRFQGLVRDLHQMENKGNRDGFFGRSGFREYLTNGNPANIHKELARAWVDRTVSGLTQAFTAELTGAEAAEWNKALSSLRDFLEKDPLKLGEDSAPPPISDLQAEMRAATLGMPEGGLAGSGISEFLASGDTRRINKTATDLAERLRESGKASRLLLEFLREKRDRNDFLRKAREALAATCGAPDSDLNPDDLQKWANQLNRIRLAHEMDDPECADEVRELTECFYERAFYIGCAVLMPSNDSAGGPGLEGNSAPPSIDDLCAELKILRAATLGMPEASEDDFGRSGIPEFLACRDKRRINRLASDWAERLGKSGKVKVSQPLQEFLREQMECNDLLREARDARAAMDDSLNSALNPDDLRKRANQLNRIRRARSHSAHIAEADDLMRRFYSRAYEIEDESAILIPLGGDARTRMTCWQIDRLAEQREEIRAAVNNGNRPAGLLPEDLRKKLLKRPDLLALMAAVYLNRSALLDERGRQFDDKLQIRSRRNHDGRGWARAHTKQRGGKGWDMRGKGMDVFTLAGKTVGREKSEDFPVQVMAVNEVVKRARKIAPNALKGLREWECALIVDARLRADQKQCRKKMSPPPAQHARGQTGLLRALTPDEMGKCAAGVMAIIDLANPRKRNKKNLLAGMSEPQIQVTAAAAAGSKHAGKRAVKFLRDTGLLEKLRNVRKFREWKEAVLAVIDTAAKKRRHIRLQAAIDIWYDAWQWRKGRFDDCTQRRRHSISAQVKAAGYGRDTMRKVRRMLERSGKLIRVRDVDLRCAFYRLAASPRLPTNAIFHALGKMWKWTRGAALAPWSMLPPVAAPPSR